MSRLRKCLCGCGHHVRVPGRRYVIGHNRRGVKLTIGHRMKLSKAFTPGHRMAIILSNKARTGQESFDTRMKKGASMRGQKLSPEHREKIGAGNRGKVVSEATREKIRQARAKQILPFKNTSIEVAMAELLKANNLNFVQHKTFKSFGFTVNGLGCPRLLGHQVDFALPEHELIIECDGNYWHNYPHGTIKDFYLDRIVKANGWTSLRFWGSEIKTNPMACLNRIREVIS